MNNDFHDYIYNRSAEVYGSDLSKIGDRLIRELEFVETFGFEKELLAAELLTQSYKERSIPYFVSGLISSLCLPYILGITEVDPIRYNIPIEMAIGISGNKIPTFIIEHGGLGFLSIIQNSDYLNLDLATLSVRSHGKPKSFDNAKVWEYFSSGYYPEIIGSDSDDMSRILRRFRPHSIEELAKALSAALSTGLYSGNAELLMDKCILTINDLPTTREDFIELLVGNGLDRESTFTIMNYIQTGRPIPEGLKHTLSGIDLPDWFLPLAEKILYLLPKSYSLELAIFAYKIALSKCNDQSTQDLLLK